MTASGNSRGHREQLQTKMNVPNFKEDPDLDEEETHVMNPYCKAFSALGLHTSTITRHILSREAA